MNLKEKIIEEMSIQKRKQLGSWATLKKANSIVMILECRENTIETGPVSLPSDELQVNSAGLFSSPYIATLVPAKVAKQKLEHG